MALRRAAELDVPGLATRMVADGHIDVTGIDGDASFLHTRNVYPELLACGYVPETGGCARCDAYRAAMLDARCTAAALTILAFGVPQGAARTMLRKMGSAPGRELLIAARSVASERTGRAGQRRGR